MAGDWNNYEGTGGFSAGTSTVDLDGSSTQTVRGSTDFYNLEISTATAQTVTFESSQTPIDRHGRLADVDRSVRSSS